MNSSELPFVIVDCKIEHNGEVNKDVESELVQQDPFQDFPVDIEMIKIEETELSSAISENTVFHELIKEEIEDLQYKPSELSCSKRKITTDGNNDTSDKNKNTKSSVVRDWKDILKNYNPAVLLERIIIPSKTSEPLPESVKSFQDDFEEVDEIHDIKPDITTNFVHENADGTIEILCDCTFLKPSLGNKLTQNRQVKTKKQYRCNACDRTFSWYSSLWSHRKLHCKEKPFKCNICGASFARRAYLKNHGRVHTGEKPFKCNECGMQFAQSPHLKNHMRIHSGERPYHCQVCNKKFARHSTLWNHRRIHTGEKPYHCNICGSAFNQATHLKSHNKVHNFKEKPYPCDICIVRFADRFSLKRHRAIHAKYGQIPPDQIDNDTQQLHQLNQEQVVMNAIPVADLDDLKQTLVIYDNHKCQVFIPEPQ